MHTKIAAFWVLLDPVFGLNFCHGATVTWSPEVAMGERIQAQAADRDSKILSYESPSAALKPVSMPKEEV